MAEATPSSNENHLPEQAIKSGPGEQQQQPHPKTAAAAHTKEEILQLVRERHVVDTTDDDLLDPLERTVRYLVPIPRTYYWNTDLSAAEQRQIPLLTKAWHQSIATAERLGNWTGRNIGMPLAASLGLTESRIQFVLDQMDEEPKRHESDGKKEGEGQDVV
jgi:hypothetical protein